MPDDDKPAPRPATMIWCPSCKDAVPFRNRLIPEVAKAFRAGCECNALQCRRCDEVIATIYAPEEAE